MAGAMVSERAIDAPDNANGNIDPAKRRKLKKKERQRAKKAEREAIRQQVQRLKVKEGAETRASNGLDGVEVEYVSAPVDVIIGDLVKTTSASKDSAGPEDERASSAVLDSSTQEGRGESVVEELKRIVEHFGSVEEIMGRAEMDSEAGQERGSSLKGEQPAEGARESGRSEGGETLVDKVSKEHGMDSAADHPSTEEPLSRKKLRQLRRPSIAALKQGVDRPDVVEVWDATAPDPEFLVYLKAYRNTVPVPRHWSQKRHFLQAKRGLEKAPFKLPAFIEATGIGEMRQAYLEKAESQKLKSKGRERMQPKMGKLDIDYQILHDAFFRHQTKPPLSVYGDLYYEGKEFESKARHARPGVLSPTLRAAVGMETSTSPPPWLVAMQRYGPPPSYPSLRIPGLNAPIPPGAEFGYHPGGWGKPPVDEFGQPIYGDVFGSHGKLPGESAEDGGTVLEEVDEAIPTELEHWGEFDIDAESSEEETSEEEEESSEEEEFEDALASGTSSVAHGVASVLPAGIETPVEVQLRKAAEEHAAAVPEHPKELFQVLEEKAAPVGAGVMGSDHVYVLPQGSNASGAGPVAAEAKAPTTSGAIDGSVALGAGAKRRLESLQKEAPTDFEVSINPADLEALDDESLKDLYEAKVKERRAAAGREDFSDLVAANAAVQKRKATEKAGTGSKEKKFKF